MPKELIFIINYKNMYKFRSLIQELLNNEGYPLFIGNTFIRYTYHREFYYIRTILEHKSPKLKKGTLYYYINKESDIPYVLRTFKIIK